MSNKRKDLWGLWQASDGPSPYQGLADDDNIWIRSSTGRPGEPRRSWDKQDTWDSNWDWCWWLVDVNKQPKKIIIVGGQIRVLYCSWNGTFNVVQLNQNNDNASIWNLVIYMSVHQINITKDPLKNVHSMWMLHNGFLTNICSSFK